MSEYQNRPPRPPETIHQSKQIDMGRKRFTFQHCSNAHGDFLRIIEERDNRRHMIVVPSDGIDDFLDAIEAVVPVQEGATT